ncbi:MAG: hypothetical protein K9M80_01725 [Candidatus Marinimicrobia bacterium]|nr:hypothetical protein [Candidatus Neomarinimicrobiota bacterium]
MKKFILTLGGIVFLFSCGSNKAAQKLFNNAKSISDKTFTYKQLENLPEPVQQYFQYALKEGQPYISYLRLKHEGVFKTGQGKKWMNIKGKQYFIGSKPGFVWIDKTKLFKAVDAYINGKGRLKVYLLSLIPIVNQEGHKIDQAELLRWLGESVWLPTNLLPSKNKKWSSIDSTTARLSYTHRDHKIYYDMTFNNRGQITKMRTQRYMGTGEKEIWQGKVSEYVKLNGMHLPSRIQGIWKLDSGDYKYADFKVQKFEYGVPEEF